MVRSHRVRPWRTRVHRTSPTESVEKLVTYHGITTHLVRCSTLDNDIALVELEPNGTVDCALACRDAAGHELAFGTEEVAIVQDLAELHCDELVSQGADVPVEGQSLDVHVCHTKDGSTGRLVATTALDTNETVLDDVNSANTVAASSCIEGEEDIDTVGVGGLRVGCIAENDLHRKATFKLDGEALRLVRSVFWIFGQLPHVSWGSGVGIFENARFVRDVEQILIYKV